MPRVTSLAPQFLVDDLPRSVRYYEKLGFTFGEPWEGFYAIGRLDGLELHLKKAPKRPEERQFRREHDHLDAAAGVVGIDTFYARCVASGVTILKPLSPTAWGTQDFSVEDPDGYVVCFGGRPAAAGSSPTLEELMHGFLDAFNRHDLDAIMSYFADDCVFYMPRGAGPRGDRFVGKANVRAGLAARLEGIPDVHYGDDRHWAGTNFGVSEWTLTGTTVTGKRLDVRGVDLLEFTGGKITRKDSFWKMVE